MNWRGRCGTHPANGVYRQSGPRTGICRRRFNAGRWHGDDERIGKRLLTRWWLGRGDVRCAVNDRLVIQAVLEASDIPIATIVGVRNALEKRYGRLG